MICLDNSVLGDLLDGVPSAKEFMAPYDDREWVVPSVVLYEAYIGALLALPRGDIEAVRDATSGIDVLPVDERTAFVAADLQRDLQRDGRRLGAVDGLVAAVAMRAGATLATGDASLADALDGRIDVVRYGPSSPSP